MISITDSIVQGATDDAEKRQPGSHVSVSSTVEYVGVVLVHGIGEQRRFQHLDWQLRELIRALQRMQDGGEIQQVSVDICSAGPAVFHAEQDTWVAGPDATADVVVCHALHGNRRETHLKIHEVWWADVNEPYSVAKQIRFWFWGLAIWSDLGRKTGAGPSAASIEPPLESLSLLNRLQLFLVGVFFVLIGYSIGPIGVVLRRVFNLQPSPRLRVLTNYVSAIKLYSQSKRQGAGLFRSEDFLDSVGFPPRISIRRRMMRAVADVVCNDYDRWYILAHSQGTVLAFNALMDTAEVWPAYLDKERWERLKRHPRQFVASGCSNAAKHNDPRLFFPPRPVWVNSGEIVRRKRMFERFRGFLTYGSPLAKFSGIWPGVVPLSKEKAFEDVPWINLCDPIDPVSGLLAKRFASSDLRPIDLGYAAGWILLIAHNQYLTLRRRVEMDAVRATLHWLLTDCMSGFPTDSPGLPARCSLRGNPFAPSVAWRNGSWFAPRRGFWRFRRALAWVTWFLVALLLLALGALLLPLLLKTAALIIAEVWKQLKLYGPGLGSPVTSFVQDLEAGGASLYEGVANLACSFMGRMVLLGLLAVGLTFLVGLSARLWAVLRGGGSPVSHLYTTARDAGGAGSNAI
jgi:hypothetical protein